MKWLMDPVSVIKSWDDLPLPPVEFKTRLCSCNVSPSCTFFLGPHWKPRHYWNWSTQTYLWRHDASSLNYNVYFILSFFFFLMVVQDFFFGVRVMLAYLMDQKLSSIFVGSFVYMKMNSCEIMVKWFLK